MFHHQIKHLEVRQKYSAARCIFNSLLSVSSRDEVGGGIILYPFLLLPDPTLAASDLFILLMFDLLQESDYFTPQGEFRVDAAGSPILLNCLMYKMCYYRFGEMQVI